MLNSFTVNSQTSQYFYEYNGGTTENQNHVITNCHFHDGSFGNIIVGGGSGGHLNFTNTIVLRRIAKAYAAGASSPYGLAYPQTYVIPTNELVKVIDVDLLDEDGNIVITCYSRVYDGSIFKMAVKYLYVNCYDLTRTPVITNAAIVSSPTTDEHLMPNATTTLNGIVFSTGFTMLAATSHPDPTPRASKEAFVLKFDGATSSMVTYNTPNTVTPPPNCTPYTIWSDHDMGANIKVLNGELIVMGSANAYVSSDYYCFLNPPNTVTYSVPYSAAFNIKVDPVTLGFSTYNHYGFPLGTTLDGNHPDIFMGYTSRDIISDPDNAGGYFNLITATAPHLGGPGRIGVAALDNNLQIELPVNFNALFFQSAVSDYKEWAYQFHDFNYRSPNSATIIGISLFDNDNYFYPHSINAQFSYNGSIINATNIARNWKLGLVNDPLNVQSDLVNYPNIPWAGTLNFSVKVHEAPDSSVAITQVANHLSVNAAQDTKTIPMDFEGDNECGREYDTYSDGVKLEDENITISFSLANLSVSPLSLGVLDSMNKTITCSDVYRTIVKVEEEVKVKIDVYPNPATSEVVVSGLVLDAEVNLYDLQGVKKFSMRATSSKAKIQVKDFPRALYIISVTSGLGHFSKTIMLQ